MDLGRMLDVAISLALMYLLLSLMCTVINEYIAGIFKLRFKFLRAGLKNLADGSPFLHAVLAHPLVKAAAPPLSTGNDELNAAKKALVDARALVASFLPGNTGSDAMAARMKAALAQLVVDRLSAAGGKTQSVSTRECPSYVSGQAFASAVLDTLNPNVQLTSAETYDSILTAINHIDDDRTRASLRAILNNAAGDLQSMRNSVASWFDTEMERLQGGYRKRVQIIALAVGLAVAFAFNADSLHVAKFLWQDQGGTAAKVAQMAADTFGATGTNKSVVQAAAQRVAEADGEVITAREAVAKIVAAGKTEGDAEVIAATSKLTEAEDARSKAAQLAAKDIGAIREALSPLPIGWPDGKLSPISILQVVGWLITAAALSLGSSFWFDLLIRFVNIRAAGPKPATTPVPDAPARP